MDTSRATQSVNAIGIAKALLVGMRPRQWYKNALIYLAFFFTINEAWTLDADMGVALALFGEFAPVNWENGGDDGDLTAPFTFRNAAPVAPVWR